MLRFFNPVWWDIRAIKKEDFSGRYEEDNPEGYRIKILYRGEQLFYQQNNRALIVEIAIDNDKYCIYVFVESIKKWDDGKKITEEEKRLILERLKRFLVEVQNTKPIFIDREGALFNLE